MHPRAKRRVSVGVAVALAVAAASSAGPASVAASPLSVRHCDFDGDGFHDLAIGVPGEDISGIVDAGVVQVLYGQGGSGLFHEGNQLWWQGTEAVVGVAQAGDAFGASLACGDFNLDNVHDLAVGVPREDVGGAVDAGAVNVLYGAAGVGLTADGNEVFTQSGAVRDSPEGGDLLGFSLAAGDFDDDALADLAIGAPGEDIVDRQGVFRRNAGAVNVLYGTDPGGLDDDGNEFLSQKPFAVADAPESGDEFGYSLAAGDFDRAVGVNSATDLAIGVPGEGVSAAGTNRTDAGATNVFYGEVGAGLSFAGDQFWSQAGAAVRGAPESYDRFATSLATGDFDNDGRHDLAAGVPGEDLGSGDDAVSSAGGVNVLYSDASGLDGADDEFWSQQTAGVKGRAEARDAFGSSLSSGDFAYSAADDLAIGVVGEDTGSGDQAVRSAGAVNLLFGTASSGLDSLDDVVTTQSDFGTDPDEGVTFGATLAAGDFDGADDDELAIGAPGQSVSGVDSAGAVHVRNPDQNQTWVQGLTIQGVAQPYDRFGGQPVSSGVYRIPYADGTTISIGGDHMSHTPLTRIDMSGTGGGPYTIVAAADGIVRAVVDSHGGPDEDPDVHGCNEPPEVVPGACSDYNNYIWIEHANGEWTKYSHIAYNSAPRSIQVDQAVAAGNVLGIEDDIGAASGSHLHWEVAVPDDPDDAFSVAGGFIKGQNLIPLVCGIPGNLFIHGRSYTAAPC